MDQQPKRRSRWPKVTLHTNFFQAGCGIGWLELLTTELGDERLSARVQDLQHRLEQASMWPQRQALEALWPLMFELVQLQRDVLQDGAVDLPASFLQLRDQLRRILPPDVQF